MCKLIGVCNHYNSCMDNRTNSWPRCEIAAFVKKIATDCQNRGNHGFRDFENFF